MTTSDERITSLSRAAIIASILSALFLNFPFPIWFGLLWEGWGALIEFWLASFSVFFLLCYSALIAYRRRVNKRKPIRYSLRTLTTVIIFDAIFMYLNTLPHVYSSAILYGWPFDFFDANSGLLIDLSLSGYQELIALLGDLIIFVTSNYLLFIFLCKKDVNKIPPEGPIP